MKRKNSVKKELIIILVVMITYYTYIRNGIDVWLKIFCVISSFLKGILISYSAVKVILMCLLSTIEHSGA